MDRKRKADQYEDSGDVTSDADAAGEHSPAAGEHSPAAAALLSMIANGNDSRAAAAICTVVMQKQESLAMKKLPDYPLRLDAVRLKQLQALQYKQNKLSKQENVRCSELEMDYQLKMKPLYQRRHELVAKDGKGVPDFWLSALVAIPAMSDGISKLDEQPLKYLMNINSYKTDPPERSLKLEFTFDRRNPFFENTVLTKVIYWNNNGHIDRTEGTRIVWKKRKCVMYRNVLENGRRVIKWFRSFFAFFKSGDEHPDEDLRLKMLTRDGEIARRIDEKILPHAFALYMAVKVSGKA